MRKNSFVIERHRFAEEASYHVRCTKHKALHVSCRREFHERVAGGTEIHTTTGASLFIGDTHSLTVALKSNSKRIALQMLMKVSYLDHGVNRVKIFIRICGK